MSEELDPTAHSRTRRRWLEAGLVLAIVSGLGAVLRLGADGRSQRSCQSNLKQAALAMFQYSRDYDERYPLGDWQQALLPYTKSTTVFSCSQGRPFAMHRGVVGRQMSSIYDVRAPMFFESTLGQINALDDGSHWPAQGVHRTGITQPFGSHVAALDGSVRLSLSKPDFVLAPKPSSLWK